MGQFQQIARLPPEEFLRDVGISLEQFCDLHRRIMAYHQEQRDRQPMRKRGKKTITLSSEDKLLLTCYYLRHYRTFAQLGRQFGIHESYACKVFHVFLDAIIKVLRLPGHQALLHEGLAAVLIDVTEQPIERPVRHQQAHYSGKKKRHTIKAQLIVCLMTLQILTLVCGQGHTHDFSLFKQSHVKIAPTVEKYADAGYQGLEKQQANSFTPIKKPKSRALTDDERTYNRLLARLRIHIEHVNRRCKIFRIVKETYRGKHQHAQKTWAAVAALVNMRYAE